MASSSDDPTRSILAITNFGNYGNSFTLTNSISNRRMIGEGALKMTPSRFISFCILLMCPLGFANAQGRRGQAPPPAPAPAQSQPNPAPKPPTDAKPEPKKETQEQPPTV